MIYALPAPEPIDLEVLEMIFAQHKRLQTMLGEPRRWNGSLRRSAQAKNIRGSNSIEGYHVTLDQAIGAIVNEPPVEYTETWFAAKGYRDALTYILQGSRDPYFEFSKQFLKSLHFMMLNHDMEKNPGQWRSGTVYVVDQQTGDVVYEAPDAGEVNGLIEELVETLKVHQDQLWAPLSGAMAHLNLTMIHPFKDGNGRMARALQTLVIARAGMRDPILCSIEEWLGDNTPEYYAVLSQVGKGKWSPTNDCLPWIRFCLKGHYQQAQRLLRRNDEYGRVFEKIRNVCDSYGLNERVQLSMFDAAIGIRVTNSRYRAEVNVSEYVASRDLKKLSELGLLTPIGDGRGRSYEAGDELKAIRQKFRSPRQNNNPYVIAQIALDEKASRAAGAQLSLPLTAKAKASPDS